MGDIPKIERHEPGDPNWQRFRGETADFIDRRGDVPEVMRSPEPTIGVGAYNCGDCTKPHVTFAIVGRDGREMNANADPEVAVEIVKALVDAIHRVGHSLLALQALRSLSLVNQLATMTDTEADMLDGGALRETCRLMLAGKPMTLPRYYDSADYVRACSVLREWASRGGLPGSKGRPVGDTLAYGGAVKAVAEALGLQSAAG